MSLFETNIFFNEEAYNKLKNYLLNEVYPIENTFILVDHCTYIHCLPILLSHINLLERSNVIKIKSGEKEKNIYTCIKIWKDMENLKANRNSLMINLGGGVITDIGGFVASVFKRGVRFINIPTTLLGMVDASIGGKTGVNLESIKNEIGSFNPPEFLIIDPIFLKTLPEKELISGMAEMFKHGLIADKNFWIDMKNNKNNKWDDLIYQSILIKNKIVEKDPKEKGLRKILNFGHTIGHALESYFMDSKKKILHGIAIAMGMVYESWISHKINGLSIEDYQEIKSILSGMYPLKKISDSEMDQIFSIMEHDKKNEMNKIQFSLLKEIGICSYNCQVPYSLIKESFLQRN
ncbi:MAG: 3-dehydroquinate synthase [Flavobacteriales bacterium]|jgi:3-dehydroquinate synthase|uniref:3-dehydroquinate synthase n=1 Tax=Blattabacterium sp. (Mastotermes darwiniensis) TaxID=39768 RepID=UPI000231DDE0|nr:3-dehydroquinate synthase [Blattabacterium sp. (Mastotermes darwiniensis)]AER40532.1 3-dehydroquinate synthase [Blattabacterium sp. (Mastotermes darwiniensis) str. MADAR]MDR1804954.1 3-dehydroquinate synthase [Flavobacteriales bacterium]